MRASGLALRIGPTDLLERGLCFLIRHAEDLSEAQGLGRFGEEEVLHGYCLSNVIGYQ